MRYLLLFMIPVIFLATWHCYTTGYHDGARDAFKGKPRAIATTMADQE